MFVGSFNLDPRSVALNTEMGVLFESPELLTTVMDKYERELPQHAYRLQLITIAENESDSGFEETEIQWIGTEDGRQVHYNTEPDTTLWQRFVVNILSVFVIEDFL